MTKQMTMMVAAIALLLTAPFATAAAISYTGGTYTQNFNTLPYTGTSDWSWTNNTTLAGWFGYGGNPVAAYTSLIRQDGTVATEGLQSVGLHNNTDRSLGSRQYGEPSMHGAQFINNSGEDLSQVSISYTGEQWYARTYGNNDLLFEYSLDATSGDDSSATWTAVTDLDFNLPHPTVTANTYYDGTQAANQVDVSGTFNLSSAWGDGTALYIRWAAAPGDGDLYRQGAVAATDDFSFSAAVPEPATMGLLAVGALGMLRRRRSA